MNRFRWGFAVVLLGSVVVLLASAAMSAPGALLTAMRSETGWSAAEISLAAAGGLVFLGLGGPISAVLIDRFGLRRVAAASLALVAVGLIGSALAREVWQVVLALGVATGLGAGLVGSAFAPVLANRWFTTRRGLVVGILGASSSFGGSALVPALAAIAIAAGWRQAVLLLGVSVAVAVIPVALLMREWPADVGERAWGSTEATPEVAHHVERGVMGRAVRSRQFWLLAGTFFICGATTNGMVSQHFIAHAVDHGFTPVTAAWALGIMGIFNFVGTLLSGWLSDRWDPRKLLFLYYGFRSLSLLYLPFLHSDMDIVAFAILFGLDNSATVPPTVLLSADSFGRRNVGLVYGFIYLSHMLGAAVAAELGGIVRDNAATYAPAFVVAGLLAMVAAVVALRMRRSLPGANGIAAATPTASAAAG